MQREKWQGKLEVLFSYIGYCVGLGGVWRYPYLCYKNGGGAFMIPYILVLIFAGIPLYFLEVALGQYSSCGGLTVWKFCPLFRGVGICCIIMCAICCTYYNVLFAYVLHFLAASMTSSLPWASCDNEWNTPACRSLDYGLPLAMNNTVEKDVTYNMSTSNVSGVVLKSPAEEYWERRMLQLTSGIDDFGGLQWELVLALFMAWLIVGLCCIKGIRSAGKVVYFTATFPYFVLIILIIRGITLPGSAEGILYYIVPNFSRLLDPKVWGDAATQTFYNLGPACGILVTYGSYNEFNHNSVRDTLIICWVSIFTSLLCGFVVFAVIGFLSHELHVPISEVVTSGPGLAFVVYPEALTRMPLAPFWSVLFFIMMGTVSVDSLFAMFETVVTAFEDAFPTIIRPRKMLFTMGVALLMFIAGLPYVTHGGIYLVTLIDWYGSAFPPLVVALLETVVICYAYGWRRFANDVCDMMGSRPSLYWIACWTVITPIIILVIFVFNVVIFTSVTYGDYVYPQWAEGVGWLSFFSSVIFIPIVAVIQVYIKAGSLRAMCASPISIARTLMVADSSWGPEHHHRPEKEEEFVMDGNVPTKDNALQDEPPTSMGCMQDDHAYQLKGHAMSSEAAIVPEATTLMDEPNV